VTLNRNPTKVELVKMNINILNDDLCSLCHAVAQLVSRMLFTHNHAYQI